MSHRRQWTCFTPLQSTRVGSLSPAHGDLQLEEREWTPERLAQGLRVKRQEVPFNGRLCKRVARDGALAWVLPKDLEETVTAPVGEAASAVRGQVEERHRGRKHLTGSAKCPGRAARAQRHPWACGYPAGVSLKGKAKELAHTL